MFQTEANFKHSKFELEVARKAIQISEVSGIVIILLHTCLLQRSFGPSFLVCPHTISFLFHVFSCIFLLVMVYRDHRFFCAFNCCNSMCSKRRILECTTAINCHCCRQKGRGGLVACIVLLTLRLHRKRIFFSEPSLN